MVSVIIPTKDRAYSLPMALDSVRAQLFQDWECFVIDDGSTDGTQKIVTDYHHRDARIHYARLSPDQQGANAARNLGIQLSPSPYLLFLDSDDALAPFCLSERVKQLEKRSELDFAVWPSLLFDQMPGDSMILWNIATPASDVDRFLELDIPWQTAGVLWRRDGLAKIGPWLVELPSWQDWEFHLRALIHNLSYQRFEGPDSYWRTPRPDSLWNHSKDQTNLDVRVALLAHILKNLQEAGMLGSRQKHLLGGLHFWHARLWYSQMGNRRKACSVWLQAWKLGLVPTGQFLEGLKWFSRITRGRSHDLKVVFPRWPTEYLIASSTTFQKITYSDLKA
jgi:glycosyltransferase involved in cell wall biosynthesis